MSDFDPRLEKVVAVWWSTTHEGERQSFRDKAEMLARQAGMTFEQAVGRYLAIREGQPLQGAGLAYSTRDDFAGWSKDAWKLSEELEAWERADKAKRSAERAADAGHGSEKASASASRRRQLLERFGSEAAVLAPCERERLLLDAVKPWRIRLDPPHERWTESVDGWSYGLGPAPPHIDAAIRAALPLPETFAAAWSELGYWRSRNQEMQDILQDRSGDCRLDTVAAGRMRIVEILIERELSVKTHSDLLARLKFYREQDASGNDRLARIYADLEGVVAKA
jgi:hypothetical protein